MNRTARLLALGAALAANAAALALLNSAMVEGAEKDRLALQEPTHMETSAPRIAGGAEQAALSAAKCDRERL